MIHTAKQLKDKISNLSKATGQKNDVLLRRYAMERLLERIALSPYRDNFILKGGMLVSAMVGISDRVTMDIDTTIRGLPLTESDMERILEEIASIPLDDNIQFRFKKATSIMEEAEYGGVRVSMDALLQNTVIPLKVDISTGDSITPHELQFSYRLMFEDRSINVMAYPVENVLAEKIHAVVTKGVSNTRMRDFYDIHILHHAFQTEIDAGILKMAVEATFANRDSSNQMKNAGAVLDDIQKNREMQERWRGFQSEYEYARMFWWMDVVHSTRRLCMEAGLLEQETLVSEVKKPGIRRGDQGAR